MTYRILQMALVRALALPRLILKLQTGAVKKASSNDGAFLRLIDGWVTVIQ